jgi:hypothetical protein
MATFRVWRLRDAQRQSFKNQEHMGGTSAVKAKDYHEAVEVEAENVYAAWDTLKETENRLDVGDVLANSDGKLWIYKYIGFEIAEWQVIEPKQISDQPALTIVDPIATVSNTIKA